MVLVQSFRFILPPLPPLLKQKSMGKVEGTWV